MRKIIIPILIYLILATVYLLQSGAPLRVHALSLLLLFFAVPLSTWLCSGVRSPTRRLILVFPCAALCFFIWDSTAQFVIAKAEFLDILRYRPWLYPLVAGPLGGFIHLISYMSDPPNKPVEGDARKQVRPSP
jgi:hypothetical protein